MPTKYRLTHHTEDLSVGNIDLVVGKAYGVDVNTGADGSAVSASNPAPTTITLLGRNFANTTVDSTTEAGNNIVYGYGHYVNQNFVDVLSHKSNDDSGWTSTNAKLLQGQIVHVSSKGPRKDILYLAGNTNTYTNAEKIEIFTEKNPPANLKKHTYDSGGIETANYSYMSIDNSGQMTIAISKVGTAPNLVANISNIQVKLGDSSNRVDLLLSNGNANVSGFVSANAMNTDFLSANATGQIEVRSNVYVNTGNINVHSGNIILTPTRLKQPAPLAPPDGTIELNGTPTYNYIQAAALYGSLANMSSGSPKMIDQPYIKSVGFLSNLSVGWDHSTTANSAKYKIGELPVANFRVTENGNVSISNPNSFDTRAIDNVRQVPVLDLTQYQSDGLTPIKVKNADGTDSPVNVMGIIRGDGGFLSNIQASALGSATIENANYAAYAGNVIIASQPQITSLGTLTGLTIAGDLVINPSADGVTNLGNIRVENSMSVGNRLVANSLVANYFYPDSVRASDRVVSPIYSTGTHDTSGGGDVPPIGVLDGRYVMSGNSYLNMATNDATLITKNITAGTGNIANIYGSWTVDSRLNLASSLEFLTQGRITCSDPDSTVDLFPTTANSIRIGYRAGDIKFGTNQQPHGNITIGSTDNTGNVNLNGELIKLSGPLFFKDSGNLYTNQDEMWMVTSAIPHYTVEATHVPAADQASVLALATTVTTKLHFATEADLINIGNTASTAGNTTINHNLIVAGANIAATQTTVNLLNDTVTTINFGHGATLVDIGAPTGNTVINNDIRLNSANIETTVATANIVNANATTVQIGGAASTLNLGAVSGTATINNPTIIGSQTTQSLWNTVATTVNFAGAASTLNIGAGNSTVNLRSNTIVGTASQTTVNLWNANATTVNFAGAANTINIGNTANANGITSIGHRLAVAGNATFSAYTTFTQTNEVVSASATLGTYDAAVASTFYHNSPTGGAFTASITNVPTTANRVMTIVIMVEQGGTPAYPSALSINGSSITPKWLSSTAPTGTASKTDIFSFSIIYVSSTWKVLGQYSTYG